MAGFGAAFLVHQRVVYLKLARTHAQAAYEKDLDYRRWNAMHNGVYVEVGPDSQPNPLLHVLEREITSPSGRVSRWSIRPI